MSKMSLSNLIELGSHGYLRDNTNWLIVEVQAYDNEPEIIINPRENYDSKLHYYSQAYNEDLTLKNNENIKIVKYGFVGEIQNWFS